MNRAVEEQGQVSTRNHHAVRGHRTYGRIVVGLDGSEGSKDALRWAARQAELTGASLDVVMTWEVPVVPYGVWTGYDAGGQAQETLDATVEEILGRSDPATSWPQLPKAGQSGRFWRQPRRPTSWWLAAGAKGCLPL